MIADPGPGAAPRAGIYVHVPFCSEICPYCDFAVVRDARRDAGARHREWLDGLRSEVERVAADLPIAPAALPFDTVYLGGGTPSALAPELLAEGLALLRDRLPLAADPALHLEANPEDVDAGALEAWRSLGVSFLSLGVQALDDETLRFLGRRHDAEAAARAIEAALAAGIPTVSVDLIYALPGRPMELWRETLDRVADLGPQHLSCYELEIHPRTVFGRRARRGELRPVPEDGEADLLLETHARLADHGWAAYEVSNFARSPEHRSRHNGKYWVHAPYLGLGPSAHSFDGGSRRWWNHRHVARWRRELAGGRSAVAGEERLTAVDLVLEALLLGLRTAAGVDLEVVRRRWGIDLAPANRERFADWGERGWVVGPTGDRLIPTVAGMAVADRLAAEVAIPLPAGTVSGDP